MTFIVSMESQQMDRRFSTDDRIQPEEVSFEPDALFTTQLDRVYEKLPLLPKKEADMLTMYYILRKEQSDIGKIFGLTQGDVSYRLKRSIERLRFLMEVPEISKQDLVDNIVPALPNINYLEVMIGMWETTSQTVVALKLKTTQGKVRYRFIRGLELLREINPEVGTTLHTLWKFFEKIGLQTNILAEKTGGDPVVPGSFLDNVQVDAQQFGALLPKRPRRRNTNDSVDC